MSLILRWWPETGSNRRRRPFQGRALPLSYLALAFFLLRTPDVGDRQERPGVTASTPVVPACLVLKRTKSRREPATQTLPKYSNPSVYRQPSLPAVRYG